MSILEETLLRDYQYNKKNINADYGVYRRKLYREYDCHGIAKYLRKKWVLVQMLISLMCGIQKSKMYLRTSHLSIKEFAEKSPSQFRKYMN